MSIKANHLDGDEDSRNASSLLLGMLEGIRILFIGELLRDIELDLKRRVERYLRKTHADQWWAHIPRDARRNVVVRRRWSAHQLGDRRILAEHDISWLSMGDVLRVLAALSPSEWQHCLDSENRRRGEFHRTLHRVKAYRDYHLAHPKPRRATVKEQAQLCTAVMRLPLVIRPAEWSEVDEFLGKVATITPWSIDDIQADAWQYSELKSERVRRWLACPDLEPPELCGHMRRLDLHRVRWRQQILQQCINADPGGRVFFKDRQGT